ncbi:5'-nucleotidase C-terminal domain-containing protein [Bacteroides sp. 519]|uniref:5'-nucleotidase C-terminal domain-containing protein n=1 Tax=Bacteroides sp. 519 TaxID=2302937 RepID=UPI0013D1F321|nr:5'-nucleotidase [Bacteroides sp. 519]NDV59907.1 5'-nucleotidase [Bacteroides sp. 519]
MNQIYSRVVRGMCVVSLMIVSSCNSPYKLTTITGEKTVTNASWDSKPDTKAIAVLAPYKAKIDSIMTPVVGKSAMDMPALRPESLLSNLVADVLRESTTHYLNETADIAVMNIGGLRNSLKKGDITYGDIYEILPFLNALCMVTMKGDLVEELMQNIVSVKGEGISNVKLHATNDGQIISCTIGGEPLDRNRTYKVATIDYLAEGNDRLVAFKKTESKQFIPEATIRQIFLDYVVEQTKQGKEITSAVEGRIIIE